MDYKKKYEDALSRAKEYTDVDTDNTLEVHARGLLEYIFPELKESEDERIRKEIISALKYANHKGVYDKHLAWLEKQGESRFTQCIQEGDKIVTNEDGTRFNTGQLERVAKKKPKFIWHREDEQNLNACLGYIPDEFLRRWLTDTIHVKYDKSVWSEEDENKVTLFMQLAEGCDNEEELADWLKSLKERMKGE